MAKVRRIKVSKKSKSQSKKKTNYKKNQGQKTKVNYGLGFPKQALIKHKYFETVDIQNTAGATALYSFRANDLYDPNATGAGHQPLYYDQMTPIYNHWVVIGSKISVTIAHNSTINNSATACVYLNDDLTTTPILTGLIEQSKCKYTVMPKANTDPRHLKLAYSAKKQFGGSIMSNINLQGGATFSPSEQVAYTIAVFPQDISSTQTYNIQVMIEYIAVWTEVKDIAGS